MKFPIVTILDFFKDPDNVLEYAKSLEYIKFTDVYPGKRTYQLYGLNENFFHLIHDKIFSVFYPTSYEYTFDCFYSGFQRETFEDVNSVSRYGATWTHNDGLTELVCIIYLCRENLGTSFYKRKNSIHIPITFNGPKLGKENTEEDMKLMKEENESYYDLILSNNSIYNSAVIFPGHIYHKANLENFKKDDDRITLITFIKNISTIRFPLEGIQKEVFASSDQIDF